MIGTFVFIVGSILLSLGVYFSYTGMVMAGETGPAGWAALIVWLVGMIFLGYGCKLLRKWLP